MFLARGASTERLQFNRGRKPAGFRGADGFCDRKPEGFGGMADVGTFVMANKVKIAVGAALFVAGGYFLVYRGATRPALSDFG